MLALVGTGSGVLAAFDSNFKRGFIDFFLQEKNNLDKFIYSDRGWSSGEEKDMEVTPTELLTNLSHYSSSIPLLVEGFAIQIAKQIFNETLFQESQETKNSQEFKKFLQGKKKEIEQKIKDKREKTKRVKKEFIHDEQEYVNSLKKFLLQKVDETSLLKYLETKEHLIAVNEETKNGQSQDEEFIHPLFFFLKEWIEKYKAGFYVHKNFSYSNEFTNSVKEEYKNKYNLISLPSSPNYFFPDYEEENYEFTNFIEKWEKGDSESGDAEILWIGNKSDTHTNIALSLLSNGVKNEEVNGKDGQENSGALGSGFHNLDTLFLKFMNINEQEISENGNGQGKGVELKKKLEECEYHKKGDSNGKNEFEDGIIKISGNSLTPYQKKNPMNLFCLKKINNIHQEFLIFKSNNGKENSKILFFRNEEGFNAIYPVKQTEIKLPQNNNFIKEFKEFIDKNFFQLLLKYRKFLVQNKKEKNTKCCCDEVIENLLKLLNISEELHRWNEIWRTYDVRKMNNDFLESIKNDNYLNKLGTKSSNPPKFLEKLNIDLQKYTNNLQGPIQQYMTKINEYFKKEHLKHNRSGSDNNYYWTFTSSDVKDKEKNCMKKEIANFLLEKIFKNKLIKNLLTLPISFKNSINWFRKQENQNNNFQGQKISILNWKNGRQNGNQELIKKIVKTINQELTLSEISEISDTTIFKLGHKNSNSKPLKNTEGNNSNKLESIENYLNLINLNNPNMEKLNEKLRILITALYLIENSFENYREYIREIIFKEGFGAYVFSLSWDKNCDHSKYELNPLKDKGQQQQEQEKNLWTPYSSKSGNEEEWNNENLDPRQCIRTSDRYSSTYINKNLEKDVNLTNNFFKNSNGFWNKNGNNNTKEVMGFKGIITREMLNGIPGDIYLKIFEFLYEKGYINFEEIKKQIQLLKTNREFNEYVNKLKQLYPNEGGINNIFGNSNPEELKEKDDSRKEISYLDYLLLAKKKELLEKFVKENVETREKRGRGGENFVGLLEKTKLEYNEETIEEDDKVYTFTSDDLESLMVSSVYLIQITTKDIDNENSFYQFAEKHLTPQMLLQDIVKQSRNVTLQAKAINHFLNRGWWAGGEPVYTLRSSDYFLKDQFSATIL